jgi:hypothetical protein
MKNFSRNTTAVLVVTLFTGLAVFSAIQLGGRLFGTSTANAQTVSAQSAQTQTGNGNAYGQSGSDSQSGSSQGYADPYGQTYSDPYGQSSGSSDSQGYSDPYGQSGSSSGSDGGQTYTCPATGCTASSCHATQ